MESKFSIKKIFGNSMWQISEKVATMLISVITTSVIARYLGIEGYGLANYIISTVMLFTAISTLGMEEINISDQVTNRENAGKIIGTSFLIRLIGGIVLIAVSQITIYFLTNGDRNSQILGAIVGSSMLFKAFEVIEYYLKSQMKLKAVSIIRFISAIIVAVYKIMVAVLDLGIVGFIASYLLDSIVVAILLYIYYKKKNSAKLQIDKNYAKNLLKRCWYIALSSIMITVYMRIDQIMIGTMLVNKSENGIYSAAVRIAEMWYFVPLAIITAFQPTIVKYKSEGNEKEYKYVMQRLYDIVAIVGIACGIIISIFGWLAVEILYGKEYMGASNILVISVWAGLFATLGSARSIWLVTEEKQKYTLVYTAIGCILNIALNSILIPQIGAKGAAIATLIAQLISNVFALMLFKKTRESSVMILKAIFLNSILIQICKSIKSSIKYKKKEQTFNKENK